MTEFIEVKTQDLSGAALNWATFCAVYPGMQPTINVIESTSKSIFPGGRPVTFPRAVSLSYSGAYGVEHHWYPSSDWEYGGPLFARFNIDFTVERNDLIFASVCDDAGMPVMPGDVNGAFGPTHLIAACRAIVASVLGETVSVPKELCHE